MRRTQLTTTDSPERFKILKKIPRLVKRLVFSMWPHLLVSPKYFFFLLRAVLNVNFTEVKVVPLLAVSFTLVYWTYAIYCYGQDGQA